MGIIGIEGWESEQSISWMQSAFGNTSVLNATTGTIDGGTKRGGPSLYSLRQGSYSSSQPSLNAQTGISRTFSDQTKITIGFGIRWNGSCYADFDFFKIGSSDNKFITFRRSGDQRVRIYNGPSTTNWYDIGTLLATSDAIFGQDSQYYIQIQITTGDSTSGRIGMMFGTKLLFDLTGLNLNTTSYKLNKIGFLVNWGYYQTAYQQLDDMYILDSTAPMNDFIGTCSIGGSRPNADGDFTDMTATTGSRYTCIDEIAADGADYVYSDNTNGKYLANFSDISNDGTIKGVRIIQYGSRSDAGSGTSKAKLLFRDNSGVEYEDPEVSIVQSGQSVQGGYYEILPIDNISQTNDLFNNLQLGQKVTQIN